MGRSGVRFSASRKGGVHRSRSMPPRRANERRSAFPSGAWSPTRKVVLGLDHVQAPSANADYSTHHSMSLGTVSCLN
jgi:hypothetical protein